MFVTYSFENNQKCCNLALNYDGFGCCACV
jgi:hypothetical protein